MTTNEMEAKSYLDYIFCINKNFFVLYNDILIDKYFDVIKLAQYFREYNRGDIRQFILISDFKLQITKKEMLRVNHTYMRFKSIRMLMILANVLRIYRFIVSILTKTYYE